MDDFRDRYARLVAAFDGRGQETFDASWLATDAKVLSDDADSTWLRVQARALAAAARAVGAVEGDRTALETIVDAPLPPSDEMVLSRLKELLPSGNSLADRLAIHDAGMHIRSETLRPAAERLLHVLRQRAHEDLDLPSDETLALAIVDGPAGGWRARLEPARLILNGSVAWTADRLLRAISSEGYPGRHLAQLMRSPVPEWRPSPETTVEFGLAAVGREVLMADFEFAHELGRIGRSAGLAWDGHRIIAVRRALDDLAPEFAAAALASVESRLPELGVDPRIRWRDPLARATSLARAAGPPLARAWLETTGQTIGLQRLLSERLVPTMLRAEIFDAGG
ncbi:MAG: hypothetical protein ACR2GO_01020 [Candidatus Limnocylindria bacterium]